MKILAAIVASWLIAGPFLSAEPGRPDVPAAKAIADYWFNGAEISRYELTQSRYGSEHPGNAVLVFVTEPFLTGRQVKNESGAKEGSVPVLKLNEQREFFTGIYPYRTMTSIFQPVSAEKTGGPLKVTASVQEWCGQVFMQMNRRDQAVEVRVASYFEREEGGNFELPAESLLEDGLWTQLRLDPSKLPLGAVSMVPGALYLRLKHREPRLEKAEAKIEASGDRWTYTVAYPDIGRKLAITFDRTFPYVIEGWQETQEGEQAVTTARLTHRLEHEYYWSEHEPADRKIRAKLGLREVP